MKIKTGDRVRIMQGKDAGKEGVVLQVFPVLERVVVEGVTQSTRHLRARGSREPGQKVTFSAPMHVSNVMRLGEKGIGRIGSIWMEKDGKRIKTRVLRHHKTTEPIS